MKTLLQLLFFLFLSVFLYAQNISNSSTVKNSFDNYFPPTIGYNTQNGGQKNEHAETIIDGKPIMGFPFIFYDWSEGSITLKDGKFYTGYKLKYDIYGQTILFLNSDRSLEVDGEIKEFTILSPKGNILQFINGKSSLKQKNNLYYELLVDAESGMLLKVYKKAIASIINQIVDVHGNKYFEMRTEYFYFDKVSKKLVPIKNEKLIIEKVLKIDNENSEKLKLGSYNFTEEKEFISFFKTFLK